MKYASTKTYGHDLGLSVAFRQWRADSHCSKVHGYALAFTLEFQADELDVNGWVVDFGAMKPFKEQLVDQFDHKLLVAGDDPLLVHFKVLHDAGAADVRVLPSGVGCEKFARLVWGMGNRWLQDAGYKPRVHLARVEVREHGANSATVYAA